MFDFDFTGDYMHPEMDELLVFNNPNKRVELEYGLH